AAEGGVGVRVKGQPLACPGLDFPSVLLRQKELQLVSGRPALGAQAQRRGERVGALVFRRGLRRHSLPSFSLPGPGGGLGPKGLPPGGPKPPGPKAGGGISRLIPSAISFSSRKPSLFLSASLKRASAAFRNSS